MANTIHVDVVSAEESIFSGEAKFVALPGEAGELGIYPRHTPLITRIRPGAVRIETADGGEEFVFVAGGILEVQPNTVTVLSDTAIRGKDLDDEKANAGQGRGRRSAEERQERHRHRDGAVGTGRDGRADRCAAQVPPEEVSASRACRHEAAFGRLFRVPECGLRHASDFDLNLVEVKPCLAEAELLVFAFAPARRGRAEQRRRQDLARWSGLTADEMQLLETTFWSAGGSRHGMAERLGFSKSKANALIAGLVEQGLLAEAGLQRSSGGRRAENLQLNAGLGVLVGVDIGATSLDVAVLRPDLTRAGAPRRSGRRARRARRGAGARARADARAAGAVRARRARTCSASASACPARSTSRSASSSTRR